LTLNIIVFGRVMNESERSAYLARLGAEPLYLRSPLEGARKSPIYQFSNDPALSGKKNVVVASDVEIKQPKSAAQSVSSEMITPPQGTRLINQGKPSLTSSFRMTFQYYLIDSAKLVDSDSTMPRIFGVLIEMPSELDKTGDSLLEQNTSVLFLNILRALGATIDKLPSFKIFNWPLDFSTDAEKEVVEEEKVKSALVGFLQRQQERDLFEHLLLFGGGDRLVFDDSDALPFSLCKVNGLPEMLAVPSLKRETWRILQEFKKVISLGNKDPN